MKVTKEQVDRIVYLRDERKWPWKRIEEDVGLDEKTCRKHSGGGGGPPGGGSLYAEAFRLFDRGGKPGDAVRQLRVTVKEAKGSL